MHLYRYGLPNNSKDLTSTLPGSGKVYILCPVTRNSMYQIKNSKPTPTTVKKYLLEISFICDC